MEHYGDITKINGHKVPSVDIICGGSPCQDLSIAGLRKGLAGERSGLFFEQIRVIEEMRDEYRRIHGGEPNHMVKPRYMVFENVQGILSSDDGRDFLRILQECARVADPNAIIPRLEGGQSWTNSGAILASGWSIAWRLHNAQFWGVAQRRRRIALIVDFGGQTAPEILFERKGLQGNPEKSSSEGQGLAANPERSIGESSYTLKIRGGAETDSKGNKAGKGALVQTELSGTIGVTQDQTLFCIEGNGARESHHGDGFKETETMYTLNTKEQHAVAFRKTTHAHNAEEGQGWETAEVSDSLNTFDMGEARTPTVVCNSMKTWSIGNGQEGNIDTPCLEVSRTLNCMHDPMSIMNSGVETVVRRLTPKEYERLQSFPDDWTNLGEWTDTKGKKHQTTDGARYRALGNSIALPFWEWMAKRMVKELHEERPTMASLFDGIGGFPLVYQRAGCEPVWASEIEEFPIAVTKRRFP